MEGALADKLLQGSHSYQRDRSIPQDTFLLSQAVVDQAVGALLVHGTISLRALRMRLQDITGISLSSRKLEIREMAELAVLQLEHNVRPKSRLCSPKHVGVETPRGMKLSSPNYMMKSM